METRRTRGKKVALNTRIFWTDMDIIVSAPGKVILHGEHAVVYGKPAIAASLDLRSYVHLMKTDDESVHLELPSIELEQCWSFEDIASIVDLNNVDISNPAPPDNEVIKLITELVHRQHGIHGTKAQSCITFLYLYTAIYGNEGCLSPIRAKVYSKLPIGEGLGSSASYSVCLTAALLLNKNLISNPLKLQDLELIDKWSFQGERIIHGNPSGIDNAVATYGGAIRFQSGEITLLESIPKLRILLTSTGVPRSTKTLVAKVRDKCNRLSNIMKPVFNAMESVAIGCENVFIKMSVEDEENCREQYAELEELIDMNQSLLQTIGVSHTKLNRICEITLRNGLHSKLTGAGGGGCTFTLLPPDVDADALISVIKELEEEGFYCFETDVGTRGVLIETKLPEGIS